MAERHARGGGLSLIMPVLNEAAGLAGAVSRAVAALETCFDEFEVIVIDDGSTDGSGPLADELARADGRVRVLHNERNLNYGISLARGIRAARCEWILHDGADLPLAPEDIGLFLPHLADSDVVVACRVDRSAHSPWRKLTSWTNRLLLVALFQPRARDLNFTQFYRRAWVQGLQIASTSPAVVTPELILRAERTGRRVRELEVPFRRRRQGKAHFGRLDDILWTLGDLLRLRLRTWRRGWRS